MIISREIYINKHNIVPTIPDINPASPIAFFSLIYDLAPKMIAAIPVGRDIYQNNIVNIEIIPNTKDIM
jgi:hypothetical protein